MKTWLDYFLGKYADCCPRQLNHTSIFIIHYFPFPLQLTQGFELYAVFGPLVTKPVAIAAINKLLRWIKKEEEQLFILSSVTF